ARSRHRPTTRLRRGSRESAGDARWQAPSATVTLRAHAPPSARFLRLTLRRAQSCCTPGTRLHHVILETPNLQEMARSVGRVKSARPETAEPELLNIQLMKSPYPRQLIGI